MKRILTITMIMLLTFSLVACKASASKKTPEGVTFKSVEQEGKIKEGSKLARLYAQVLDSFIPIDSGLNSDMKYIAIDTNTLVDATAEDKEYILKYFEKYNVEVLDESFESLKGKDMVKDGNYIEGILFRLDVEKISISKDKAVIEGSKFRSGLGAIGVKCEAIYENDNWIIEKAGMMWIS